MRGPVVEERVLEDGRDDRLDLEVGSAVEPDERLLGRDGRRHRDEVAPQLAHEERGVERVAHAEAAGVVPAEVPALAEDRLDAVVMPVRVVAEVDVAKALLPVVPPPGQGTGLLADVVLGVSASGAEGEELHQLTRVVLVRVPLGVVAAVQPDEHGRVLRQPDQQRLEGAEPVRAHEPVLVQHPLLRADPVVRGREPVVPDERHPLDQLLVRAHHAIEPPEVVVPPGVARRERSAVAVGGRLAHEADARRVDQLVDRPRESLAGDGRRLARLRPEAGPPKQSLGLLLAERAVVHGNAAAASHPPNNRGRRDVRRPLFV